MRRTARRRRARRHARTLASGKTGHRNHEGNPARHSNAAGPRDGVIVILFHDGDNAQAAGSFRFAFVIPSGAA